MVSGCKKNNDDDNNEDGVVMYADIANAKIAYKTYGSGEPLIMCIGFSTNMDLWSTKAIEILQTKYKVIVFDYRGMGLSTNTESTMSVSALAEDLNALLSALRIDKTHVLGWSMGGYVAQMFAINHPEKVNKLVLYATNCGDTLVVNPSQEIIDILENPAATPMERLSLLFTDEWMAANPEPWKFLPEATEPYNYETIGMQYLAIQEWLEPDGGSAQHLHLLNMPVLVICGDKDKVVPSQNSTLLADSISSATLIKVQDSGHGLMYQLPETFANYILTFLKQ
ncbi:MAG: alpha/beta hydrolase [Bacteroidales bacterium]|nr:alpha/beta hydrolase [Bacteroidales bacterium]